MMREKEAYRGGGMQFSEYIEHCLLTLKERYEKQELNILTESDLAIRAYKLLSKEIEPIQLHGELRPFKHKTGQPVKNRRVIRELPSSTYECPKFDWCKHSPNAGARFDLSVIEYEDEYLEKAKLVQPRPYWRYPSYPFEAFKAIIEFKVRVNGNVPRILKDVEKIRVMCSEEKGKCIGYLLVLDRKAKQSNLTKIQHAVSLAKDEGTRIGYYDPTRNIPD